MKKEKIQEYVDEYAEMIFKIALNYMGNKDDAEDILQDVFVKYIKKEPIFKNKEHEKNWFIRVTMNLCCNEVKSAKRTKNVPYDENYSKSIKFETECENQIYDCIRKLKNNYRKVVELYYFNDMKICEISRCLKISENTIKKRLERARKMMKKEIEKENID